MRQNLNPTFGTPSGPWQVASLTAPGVNWASTYLVTAGGRLVWFVAGTQVSAVTNAAGQISIARDDQELPALHAAARRGCRPHVQRRTPALTRR